MILCLQDLASELSYRSDKTVSQSGQWHFKPNPRARSTKSVAARSLEEPITLSKSQRAPPMLDEFVSSDSLSDSAKKQMLPDLPPSTDPFRCRPEHRRPCKLLIIFFARLQRYVSRVLVSHRKMELQLKQAQVQVKSLFFECF